MTDFNDHEQWVISFDAEHLAYFALNDVPKTVTDCIDDAKWRDALELWAEKNKVAENVKFLIDYKSAMGSLDASSIDMEAALKLFDTYVPESAPSQINIASDSRKKVEKAVADYRRFQEHGEHSPEGVFESWGGNQPPPPDFMENAIKEVCAVSRDFYRLFTVAAEKVRTSLGKE